jgi:hypothetical protein
MYAFAGGFISPLCGLGGLRGSRKAQRQTEVIALMVRQEMIGLAGDHEPAFAERITGGEAL